MNFIYSNHWNKKRNYRKEITDDIIEYAIINSYQLRDKYWEDASNAIYRIPSNGRLLKVIYKKIGKNNYKIITAFWLD